jgi:hypothetical protein
MVQFPLEDLRYFKRISIKEISLSELEIKSTVPYDRESIRIPIDVEFTVKVIVPEKHLHTRHIDYYPSIRDTLLKIFDSGEELAKENIFKNYSGIQAIVESFTPLELLLNKETNSGQLIKDILEYGNEGEYSSVKDALSRIGNTSVLKQIENSVRAKLSVHNLELGEYFVINIPFDKSKFAGVNSSVNDFEVLQELILKKKNNITETLLNREMKIANANLKERKKIENEKLENEEEEKARHLGVLNDKFNKFIESYKTNKANDQVVKLYDVELSHEFEAKRTIIEGELIKIREEFFKSNIGKEYLNIDSFISYKNKFSELKEKEFEKERIQMEKEIKLKEEQIKILPEKLAHELRKDYQTAMIALGITSKLAQQELLLNFSKFDATQKEELVKALGEEISKSIKSLSGTNQNINLYNLSTGNLLAKVFEYFSKGGHNNSLRELFNLVRENMAPPENIAGESKNNSGNQDNEIITL